jgi:hypothetical protein
VAVLWNHLRGAGSPLSPRLDAFLRIEYRFHYYNRRGGEQLEGDLLLGTQAIRRRLGIQWKF